MKESVRIFRFIIVGTLNALITALVIWVLFLGVGCYLVLWLFGGFVCGLVNNFFWSKYWIFSSRSGKFEREVPLFLVAFGCAYGLQFLSLLLMVEIGDMNEYLAQFLGLFVYGAVNFTMNKRLTFTRKQ